MSKGISASLRRGAVALAGAALILSGCTAAPPASEPELLLRLGHSYGAGSLQDRAANMLSEQVAESSDGRIEIEVYPASQLGSWEDMQEGLEYGAVDIVIESVGSLERYTDLAAIEGVPFLYEDEAQFLDVWEGELGDEILDAVREDTGFQLLGQMYRGARVLNTQRPVAELADTQSLKLRVPTQQTYLDTWESLGASPTPLALSEVFTAIEQGAVEGQENPIDVVRFNSFYEVAPNVTLTNHIYGNFHFQAWAESYQGWPAELRDIVDAEIADVSDWYEQTSIEERDANIAFLEENGVEFHEIDRAEWADATSEVLEHVDPQVVEWVEKIRASAEARG
ncbi:TRAP transporter substrate-binding protein [Pseudoclavibacter terrae]|uniref:TRAP transporter substrate-binding protein n=1 Tax=Pseudoclavibacter terrae TaxID=1530195 RepID=UPI00232FC9BD|nr:TRAP transporter substrate-binding protein [Pseudoclavibacter terrae]